MIDLSKSDLILPYFIKQDISRDPFFAVAFLTSTIITYNKT